MGNDGSTWFANTIAKCEEKFSSRLIGLQSMYTLLQLKLTKDTLSIRRRAKASNYYLKGNHVRESRQHTSLFAERQLPV